MLLFIEWIVAVLAVAVSAHPNLPSDKHPNSPSSSSINLMCQQANAVDKANEKSYNDFFGCLDDVVAFKQLQNQIDGAKSNRSELNGVINKYCAKTTQLKTCVHTYVDGVAPCATTMQKAFFTKNLVDQVIDYGCYNESEKITSFISENGTECLQAQSFIIFSKCTDQSLAFLSKEDKRALIQNENTLSLAKYCGFYDQYVGCLLTSVKLCDPPTPGNILEDMYKFIRKNSFCNDALPLTNN